MNQLITKIQEINYPDFVAFIGQSNSPPRGEETIKDWILMSLIDSNSKILDLACSNGFSSRMLAKRTGCSAIGIDISSIAIKEAMRQAGHSELKSFLDYQVADATCLPFDNQSFTHVISGASFGFIEDRKKALAESHRVLAKNAYLCVSNFYYKQPPSEAVLNAVEAAIDYRPDPNRTDDFWKNFFSEYFFLVKEYRYSLPVKSPVHVSLGVYDLIFNKLDKLQKYSSDVKEVCFERLNKIRLTLNEHYYYQGLSVAVWQRKSL